MTEAASWCLEGYVDDNREVWRTMVHRLPFQVGRRADSDLVLPFGRVSHKHASLFARQSALWLRDLGSTNGTFVNGKRVVDDCRVSDGDIVHFADHEFRLVSFSTVQPPSSTQTIRLDELQLPSHNFDRIRNFRKMLEHGRARAVFQPLVALADNSIMGYEVLGRGDVSGVETPPTELFYLAEAQGLEVELSAAFRDKGVEEAEGLPGEPRIFVNSHPAELLKSDLLLASLDRLRQRFPARDLVLEIHESAIADMSALQALRADLEQLDIGIAFDDFGTGQARLLELTDVSPQFVKFDRAWVKDLHRATRRRLELVQTLSSLVSNMGIATVAEGIECREEAEACVKLGFEYAQGYYFGRPSPVKVFSGSL
jgi:EAL domain-containing protein (putative c-di-GMP-specific phosphodiesterase class I)